MFPAFKDVEKRRHFAYATLQTDSWRRHAIKTRLVVQPNEVWSMAITKLKGSVQRWERIIQIILNVESAHRLRGVLSTVHHEA